MSKQALNEIKRGTNPHQAIQENNFNDTYQNQMAVLYNRMKQAINDLGETILSTEEKLNRNTVIIEIDNPLTDPSSPQKRDRIVLEGTLEFRMSGDDVPFWIRAVEPGDERNVLAEEGASEEPESIANAVEQVIRDVRSQNSGE